MVPVEEIREILFSLGGFERGDGVALLFQLIYLLFRNGESMFEVIECSGNETLFPLPPPLLSGGIRAT